MIEIHSYYVKAIDEPVEGRVFPVKPGCESEAIELFRTVVDRCAEKAGRGDERPEALGIFIASDTVKSVIPDGTHEPFHIEVSLELTYQRATTRPETEQNEAEVDPFIAEVMDEVRRREEEKRNETEI